MRHCSVVFGGIGRSNQDLLPIVDCDDGAYDLLDVEGTPEAVGKAIGEALKATDICHGRDMSGIIEDEDGELYLTVKVRIRKAEGAETASAWTTEEILAREG